MPLLGKEQMAGAFPAGGSIFCERGGIAYAPARDAGERKLMRVRLPPFAPIYRGVVGIRIHGGLKIRWASTPVPVQIRPPRPCGCVWKSRPGGFKNRCASGAWACKSPQPHQFFSASGGTSIHASLRNSRAQACAGANPVSPTNLLSPCPLTSTGDPFLKWAMWVRVPSRRPYAA